MSPRTSSRMRRALSIFATAALVTSGALATAMPAQAVLIGTISWNGTTLTNGSLIGAVDDQFKVENSSPGPIYIVNGTGVARSSALSSSAQCTLASPVTSSVCSVASFGQLSPYISGLGSFSLVDAVGATLATFTITAASGSGAAASAVEALPSPIVQQFGKPASGTCDAAAPVTLNWGGAGSGGWGESWAQWVNGGKGGAVCTRTLVYSNNLGAWTVG